LESRSFEINMVNNERNFGTKNDTCIFMHGFAVQS
jgi:hypothetical protein